VITLRCFRLTFYVFEDIAEGYTIHIGILASITLVAEPSGQASTAYNGAQCRNPLYLERKDLADLAIFNLLVATWYDQFGSDMK